MTAHSTHAATSPALSQEAAVLFKDVREAIDTGKSDRVTQLLDRAWRNEPLLRAVLLSEAKDFPDITLKRDPTPNSPLIVQAIDHATDHGPSGSIEALIKAARGVYGLAETMLSLNHWNDYHGRVLRAAVWRDTCHGVTHAVTGLLNGIRDDAGLVEALLVKQNSAAYSDGFLHSICRDGSEAILRLGIGVLHQHNLLVAALDSRNAYVNTPLHVLGYRGARSRAEVIISAVSDSPRAVIHLLTAENRIGRTPTGYDRNYYASGCGTPEALHETQCYLVGELRRAMDRVVPDLAALEARVEPPPAP